MTQFICTLRISFEADDEVSAQIIAEQVRSNAATDLEEDDCCDLTQIIPFAARDAIIPQELLHRLARTRNDLIRTRLNSNFQLALELDKAIHTMYKRMNPDEAMVDYDFGRGISLADAILNHGADPDE